MESSLRGLYLVGLSQSTQMAYTLSFVVSPIICCENFAAFPCFIAASSWTFTSFPISFAILTTVGTSYLVVLLLQHPDGVPAVLKSMDVKMERSCFTNKSVS